ELKTKPRKTVQDYMSLPEGTLAELIDGEIFMSPTPTTRHQTIVLNLAKALDHQARTGGLGRVFIAPLDVHLPSGDIVEPDVLFVRTANLSILRDWVFGV